MIAVANEQTTAITMDNGLLELVGPGGVVYSSSSKSMDIDSGQNLFLSQINPGLNKEGTVIFDVPASLDLSTLAFRFRGGFTGDSAELPLKVQMVDNTPQPAPPTEVSPSEPPTSSSPGVQTAGSSTPAASATTQTATTTEPAQPTPDNSTAGPAQYGTMQPFTSADGSFSVLFPTAPQQSSHPVHFKNGETTMQYRFACADNGTSYFVSYADYPPDVVGPSPQAFLQGDENVSVNGKTLLTDAAGYLDGAPGRAFTFTCSYADGSIRSCNVHAFLSGTRLYTLMVVAQKGYTATQADQFLNSFKILDNPPRP